MVGTFTKKSSTREIASTTTLDPMLKPAAHPEAPDSVGVYPANVRIPVLEGRRYLWTTRVFAIGFYISMALNIALGFAVFSMAPLKRVEPFLLTFNEEQQQVVRVQPFTKNAVGMDLFVEKLSGEYVKMREEILLNDDEMRRRWTDYLRFRTEPTDYAQFVQSRADAYKQLKERGIMRTVDITRIERRGDNVVEVYFTSVDRQRIGTLDSSSRRGELLRNDWRAILRIGFVPQQVTREEQYVNPLGFTVLQYQVDPNQ